MLAKNLLKQTNPISTESKKATILGQTLSQYYQLDSVGSSKRIIVGKKRLKLESFQKFECIGYDG